MPKKAEELSAKAVRDLAAPGRHPVGGVDGLMLRILPTGSKQWVLRATTGATKVNTMGKTVPVRRDLGLGGFPDISLSQARERARQEKEKLRQGVDPVAERKAIRQAMTRAATTSLTFAEAAKQCHAVKAREFKNAKHASQWITTLENYVNPTLGRYPVADIDTPQVLAVLQPIWAEIPETASRVRQRMAAVFDWARAAKIRTEPNPAAWKDCLEPLLPQTNKLRKTTGKAKRHHPALPIPEMPRLMADLASRQTPSAYALRFAILTAARSAEVRLATWDEIDLDSRVWRLGAERMKAGKPHTAPLSDAAMDVLRTLMAFTGKANPAGLIFAGKKGVELSDMSLSKLLKDVHAADLKGGGIGYTDPTQGRVATPHGTARSTFKDWCRRNGRFPDEWSELAMAHVHSDETRSAYARNELLEERRGMMQAWGQYCDSLKAGTANVVTGQFRR